jgi:hypothetical protein
MKKPRSRKNIPISAAKRIAKASGYDEVVIFGYDPVTGQEHVTTYGRTLVQCKDAARAGNFLKKALGWAEAQCHAKPARDKTPIQPPLGDSPYRIQFSGVSLDPKLMKCHVKGCRNGACTSVWNYPGIPGRVQTDLCAAHVQELYERMSIISAQSFSIPSFTPGVGPIPIEVRHDPPLLVDDYGKHEPPPFDMDPEHPGMYKGIFNTRSVANMPPDVDFYIYAVEPGVGIRLPVDVVERHSTHLTGEPVFMLRTKGTLPPDIAKVFLQKPMFREAAQHGHPFILDLNRLMPVYKGAKMYDFDFDGQFPGWWVLTKIDMNLINCEHRAYQTKEEAEVALAQSGLPLARCMIRQIPPVVEAKP